MRTDRHWTAIALLASALLWFHGPSVSAASIGVGAMGDSLTDEYYLFDRNGGKNWVEQLATNRSAELNFGEFSSTSRGAPRYVGYAHNWARSGASTTTLIREGQHIGLAAQVMSSNVDVVYIGIGANDFSHYTSGEYVIPGIGNFVNNLTDSYRPIYSNQMTDEQILAKIDGLAERFITAVDTVQTAGARVVVGTAVDYNSLPRTLDMFRDPAKRQRVSAAVAETNLRIKRFAQSRGLPMIDAFGWLELNSSGESVTVDGVAVKPGRSSTDPTSFFLGDGQHPGTLVQGIFANAFIEASNRAYGTNFTPLSPMELLQNAGINPPMDRGETVDSARLVIMPNVPEPTGMALFWFAMIGFWRRHRPLRGSVGWCRIYDCQLGTTHVMEHSLEARRFTIPFTSWCEP